MFTIDPNIKAVSLKGKKLFKALFSMNVHRVATPEMGLADAHSYVFFFREGDKRLSAYIGIYLLNADRALFYLYSENPFPADETETVEEEARNFLEGLGAMLDEIDCAQMSNKEKDDWIEAQVIFAQKSAPVNKPEAPPVAAGEPKVPQTPGIQQPPQTPPVIRTPQVSIATAPPPAAEPQRVQTSVAPAQAPLVMQPVPEPLPTNMVQPRETALADSHAASGKPGLPLQPEVSLPREARKRAITPHDEAAETQKRIIQKAVKAGIIKAPKQETPSTPGVVSRDREALARLLTSF